MALSSARRFVLGCALASGFGCETQPTDTAVESANAPLVGKPAPSVELVLQNGKRHALSEFRGKNVVLFFYPEDNTRGCRVEAHGFRDSFDELRARNAVVFGVSMQGAESHRSFIDNENLPYDLVVDESGDVARAFGVAIVNSRTARDSVWIDPNGKVAKVWRGVSPLVHPGEVIAAIPKQ